MKIVDLGRAVLFISLLGHVSARAQSEEVTYWELAKRVSLSSEKPPNMYWKLKYAPGETSSSGSIEVFDACTDKKVANAVGDIKQWSISELGSTQTANSDEQGNIEILLEDGKLYAKGHRIKEMSCDAKGNPVGAIEYIIPPITKKTTNLSSGAAHLLAAVGKTLYVTRPVTPTLSKPNITETKVKAQTLVCKSAPMTQEAVKTLTDNPILTADKAFYPGNLIQGKDLTSTSQARFTPVRVPRAGGRISIRGVSFKDPNAMVYVDVDQVSASTIEQARQKLLSQEVAATEALATFDMMQVYSNEQMMFALGVDGRYGPAEFNTKMQVDTKSKKNYVLARFQQIYYTLNFEDPMSPFDVFKDGEDFKDPWNTIGADNPPLLFSQVGYGRAIYFLASSTESATNIKAAFEGAYGNKDAGNYIGLSGETDFKSVMENTSIAYFALGGDAVTAVQPIKEATPAKMFDAIKKVIADAKVGKVGPESKGLPLTYTLTYLTSLSPAMMSYSTTYDHTDCKLLDADKYSFSIEHYCVDDSVQVFVDQGMGAGPQIVKHLTSAVDVPVTNLDMDIPSDGKNTTVNIKGNNIAGPWCADYRIKRVHIDPKTDRADVSYLRINGSMWMPSEALDDVAVTRDLNKLRNKELSPKERVRLFEDLIDAVGQGRDPSKESELDTLEISRKKLVQLLDKHKKRSDEPVDDPAIDSALELLAQAKAYQDSVFLYTYFRHGGGNWNVGTNVDVVLRVNRKMGSVNVIHD